MPRGILGCLATSLALVAGCSQSGVVRPRPLNAPIGAEGGELKVGIGEVSLTVPQGALDHDVYVSVAAGQATGLPSWRVVGKAYAFEPADTAFALPAQVVISYDTTLVSLIVDPTEIRVGFRNAAEQTTELIPDYVDPGAGRVNFATEALGTFWVLAPDVTSAPLLFPLNRGNKYAYDTGLAVTVDRTTDEPNFNTLEVVKVTFSQGGRTWGIYLDDSDGRLSQRGAFDDPGFQEIYALPVLLVGDRDALGTLRPAAVTYSSHVPYGSPAVAHQGVAQTTTELLEHETIRSAVGGFDTVRVPVTTLLRGSAAQERTDSIDFSFAQGVGPVALSFGGATPRATVVSGTVRGRPVVGW